MSATGSHLTVTTETFGAFPFAHMSSAFQCPGLRKHPGVGRGDLLQTERIGYRFPWSTQPVFTSSALQGGVVDKKAIRIL